MLGDLKVMSGGDEVGWQLLHPSSVTAVTVSDGRVGTGGNHPAHQICLLPLIVISLQGLAVELLQCNATNHWLPSVANLVQTSCLQREIGLERRQELTMDLSPF